MAYSKHLVFAGAIALSGIAAADTKIKTKYITGGGQPTETTVYTKDARQRYDYGEGALIQQNDLKRMIQVNHPNKTYTILPSGPGGATTTVAGVAQGSAPVKRGGIVTIKTDMVDTGERKQAFGYTARRLKMTTSMDASPDACSPGQTKMESDGWYIDLDYPTASYVNGGAQQSVAAGGCKDEIRTEQSGSAKFGFPIAYTMRTWSGKDGKPTEMSMEVLELSTAALEASVFEPPAGYNEASVPGLANMGSSISSAARAKAAGTMRVGVAPIIDAAGSTPNAGTAAGHIATLVRSQKVDAVMLPAGDLVAAAKEAQCDYILHTEITNPDAAPATGAKKFGRFARGLSRVAAPVSGVAAGSSSRVDYKVFRVGETNPMFTGSENAGAKGGGFNLGSAMGLAANASAVGMMAKGMGAHPGLYDGATLNMMTGMGGQSPAAAVDPMGGSLFSALSHTQTVTGAMPGSAVNPSMDYGALSGAFEREAKAVVTAISR